MAEFRVDDAGDRLVITLDPGEPIELGDLSQSLAALARMYERHYRKPEDDNAPKLYVSKLETGSIIAEIVPLGVIMGSLAVMDGGLVVTEFTNRVWRTIRFYAGGSSDAAEIEVPSKEDAADIREFTKPLLGKNGASLGIKHAKFERGSGAKKTVIEYKFDEAELNRAALRMDEGTLLPPPPPEAHPLPDSKLHLEVMLFLEQANHGPGKEAGRTGDRGKVPDISEKVVPVYFKKRVQGLKQRMMDGDDNPFGLAFVVDVHATVEGETLRATQFSKSTTASPANRLGAFDT